MSEFTASNGIRVKFEADAGGRGRHHMKTLDSNDTNLIEGHAFLGREEIDALREFFQHERDEELGRWRWPENPEFVVPNVIPTKSTRVARVMDERDMSVRAFSEESISSYSDFPEHRKAAKAFFAVHPEPKPWHRAKDGEVWVLTVKDVDEAWAVKMGTFRDTDGLNIVMPLDNSLITAGRRIWPEKDAA